MRERAEEPDSSWWCRLRADAVEKLPLPKATMLSTPSATSGPRGGLASVTGPLLADPAR